MTETTRQADARFDVLPDGTLESDDGADGHLAGMLRYVCRMGAQIGALLELGDLERVSTLSNVALTARISGTYPDHYIKAQVAPLHHQISHYAASAVAPHLSAQELIVQALKRVTINLSSEWAAFITDDGRLVGAVHDKVTGHGAPDTLPDIGMRALAILGALDPEIIGAAVRLDFPRGSVLISPVGEHAVYAHTDNFEVSEVARTFSAVRGLLAGAELTRADIVTSSRPA